MGSKLSRLPEPAYEASGGRLRLFEHQPAIGLSDEDPIVVRRRPGVTSRGRLVCPCDSLAQPAARSCWPIWPRRWEGTELTDNIMELELVSNSREWKYLTRASDGQ